MAKGHRRNRADRLKSAGSWLSTYNGQNLIRGYRKHYGVDLECAIIELGMLGVTLDSKYVQQLRQSELARRTAKRKRQVTKLD